MIRKGGSDAPNITIVNNTSATVGAANARPTPGNGPGRDWTIDFDTSPRWRSGVPAVRPIKRCKAKAAACCEARLTALTPDLRRCIDDAVTKLLDQAAKIEGQDCINLPLR